MTKQEARRELAERLMLLAESLLDDDEAGQYEGDEKTGKLEITSTLGNSVTVIAITKWDEYEEEWASIIF